MVMEVTPVTARTSRLAIASFGLALVSLVALVTATVLRSDAFLLAALLLGIAALLLGLMARRAITGSAGRLRGRRLAVAGWLLPAIALPGCLLVVPGSSGCAPPTSFRKPTHV
jgi:hypothetical protein